MAVGIISATGLYTPPATPGTHTIVATNTTDSTKTASATVAVTDLAGVLTHHNNLARDGTNTQEFALTPATVNSAIFGKRFSCPVDGAVYTQPLWMPSLNVGGAVRNVIFVATQHDSVYAFDADASPCVTLWQAPLLNSAHGGSVGETPVPTADVGNGYKDIQPEIGVTGTPVIDPSSSTLYVVSKSENLTGTFYQQLHALDLASGNEKFSGPVPITATVPGTGDGSSGGNLAFNPQTHNQRSALALSNGVVYIAWASHEDKDPYHGWILGYNATTLARVKVLNVSPDGSRTGIWMAGAAPAFDSAGNLYATTGNGLWRHGPEGQHVRCPRGDGLVHALQPGLPRHSGSGRRIKWRCNPPGPVLLPDSSSRRSRQAGPGVSAQSRRYGRLLQRLRFGHQCFAELCRIPKLRVFLGYACILAESAVFGRNTGAPGARRQAQGF